MSVVVTVSTRGAILPFLSKAAISHSITARPVPSSDTVRLARSTLSRGTRVNLNQRHLNQILEMDHFQLQHSSREPTGLRIPFETLATDRPAKFRRIARRKLAVFSGVRPDGRLSVVKEDAPI